MAAPLIRGESSTRRLYSGNVNGLRAAVKKGLLDWLLAIWPDVLCLQETRTAPSGLPAADLHPDSYRSCSAVARRSGYSGVATYSRRAAVAWRAGLDYCFVHERLLPRVRDAGLSPEVVGSDHCPAWPERPD